MSEMAAKPQTPALPVGKGPESRKTAPSRKLCALSHLKFQDAEEGLGYFRWGVLFSSPGLFAEPLWLQTGSILLWGCKETPQALS